MNLREGAQKDVGKARGGSQRNRQGTAEKYSNFNAGCREIK
jgi:hypothetical protein